MNEINSIRQCLEHLGMFSLLPHGIWYSVHTLYVGNATVPENWNYMECDPSEPSKLLNEMLKFSAMVDL